MIPIGFVLVSVTSTSLFITKILVAYRLREQYYEPYHIFQSLKHSLVINYLSRRLTSSANLSLPPGTETRNCVVGIKIWKRQCFSCCHGTPASLKRQKGCLCLKLIIGFNSLLISKCCYVKENCKDDFKGLKYSVLCSKVVLHVFGPAVFASDL